MQRYHDSLQEMAAATGLRTCRNMDALAASAPDGLVNFSSNDYLGLSKDERLQWAAIEAIRQYGTGSAASRLISGTRSPVLLLEEALADFKNAEAALVFNSGYQANVAILQAILAPGDWVFCDRLNHASLVDGVQLSGARWTRYRHLDLEDLARRLQKAPAGVAKWIVTDSVFSMDGDYGDLTVLCDVAEQYGAAVMVDEAHATGLYGEQGGGLCGQFGISRRVALQMGTFSKALGGFGAYVAGSRTLIDYLINRARGFIYSTALPPAVIGAAQEALNVVRTDPVPRERLWQNVRHLENRLLALGILGQPLQSSIIPLVLGETDKTMALSARLLEAGFFVQGIRPPTVPTGTARLRMTVTAAHTLEELERLADALGRLVT